MSGKVPQRIHVSLCKIYERGKNVRSVILFLRERARINGVDAEEYLQKCQEGKLVQNECRSSEEEEISKSGAKNLRMQVRRGTVPREQ
jgi:hypothetical protein